MTNAAKFARKFVDLIQYAEQQGIKVLCTSLWRDPAEQLELFYNHKSKADGVNHFSMHQLGRAADLVILNDDGGTDWNISWKYHKLGSHWESLGGTWGHRWFEQGKTQFDDIYHFEM
jgi:hypothetical protein